MHSIAATRTDDHQLQTPHIVLRHRNGHSVQVIGVLHYALPSTWKAINKRLWFLANRGWSVHYEQVKPVPDMTAREKGIHRQLQLLRVTLGNKLGQIGAIYQGDGVNYPSGAVNTDTTIREVYASYKGSLLALAARVKLARVIFQLTPASSVVGLLESGAAQDSSDGAGAIFDNKVLLDLRNRIAVANCIATPQNVVMVWGAAHVDGIVSLLLKRGYYVTQHHWTTMLPLHS